LLQAIKLFSNEAKETSLRDLSGVLTHIIYPEVTF